MLDIQLLQQESEFSYFKIKARPPLDPFLGPHIVRF